MIKLTIGKTYNILFTANEEQYSDSAQYTFGIEVLKETKTSYKIRLRLSNNTEYGTRYTKRELNDLIYVICLWEILNPDCNFSEELFKI